MCLREARAGNRHAMNRLVAELNPLVWNVARGHRLDQHTAEDVVQTVWLALVDHVDQVREPKALAGWLITTTRHEAMRVKGRKPALVALTDEMAEAVPSTQPAPEAEMLRKDRDSRLWRAFGVLSERDQELLRLTVLNGRADYHEVARKLGLSVSSIGKLRNRALQRLRTVLDDESHEAPQAA